MTLGNLPSRQRLQDAVKLQFSLQQRTRRRLPGPAIDPLAAASGRASRIGRHTRLEGWFSGSLCFEGRGQTHDSLQPFFIQISGHFSNSI